MSRPSEFELIAKLFAPLATAPGAFALKDDAAVVPARAGCDLVATTDALVEGVHFLRGDPPDTIARKALRVNLSDLAAKGAEPDCYLMVLSLPQEIDTEWLGEFVRGLGEDQGAYGISLLGGDTTATPGPLTIAITAFGHVPGGAMIRRDGARPGDLVFVSGTIGDGGGGLAVSRGGGENLCAAQRDELIARYRLPIPRLALGRGLRAIASAALDVSDGLVADLGHIAETSSVRIAIEARRVPLSPALVALWGEDARAVVRAATAGDDYEIAFAAPPSAEAAIMDAARLAAVPVTRIGRVEPGSGVALLDADAREIAVARAGFTHFFRR